MTVKIKHFTCYTSYIQKINFYGLGFIRASESEHPLVGDNHDFNYDFNYLSKTTPVPKTGCFICGESNHNAYKCRHVSQLRWMPSLLYIAVLIEPLSNLKEDSLST
jgi:hypothetical protein